MNRAWRSSGGQFLGKVGARRLGQSPRLRRSPAARTTLVVLAVLLGLALIGVAIDRTARDDGDDLAAVVPAQGGAGSTSRSAPVATQASAGGDIAAAMSEPESVADVADAATGGTGAQTALPPATGAQVPPALDFDRKIVRNATVALTVQDVDQAIGFVRDAAIASGGFVFSSSTSYQGDLKYGQIVVQVPFDQFDAVMNGLRNLPGLERIDNETTTSQDVTSEYVDTEARIRNLQATEQSYVALLGQATDVEDIILVQSYLNDVRGQIETLQGRLKYLDGVTAYSSITISFAPVPPVAKEEPAVQEATDNAFVRAADEAWGASLAVLGALGVGLIRVVVFLWWLIPLGLVAYGVARRRRGRAIAVPAAPPTQP